MELWGGFECTVNRIGEVYRDQLRLTGHHDRIGDLALVAELGIRTLRYPILWERVAPDAPDDCDWRWSDERIDEIARLGMVPIAGLLHHGSGPRYTGLLDPDFALRFADYAAKVATRYPHIRDWTPINEPLTTARFSALYGHWYPHARDERLFWIALLNQIDATQLAMQAIRAVVPGARLIQTEDLGQTYSRAALRPVADFYNHRRWMTWDLLTGAVVPGHALWEHLIGHGLGDRLAAIASAPCRPDVIGLNHYVTSHRFLDDWHRPDQDMPPVGYHDDVAARVLVRPPASVGTIVRDIWMRYAIPVAVTEAHLSCTREEQLRWLWRIWRDCEDAAADGVPVEAVTVWSLLGAVDWCSLLTEFHGRYQTGVFDASSGSPRPTALASLIRDLAQHGPASIRHMLAEQQGWWLGSGRLTDATRHLAEDVDARGASEADLPILITGATGTLGRALAGACRLRGLTHVITDREALTIDDPASIARALDHHRPWAVINAAGWVRVDDAEDHEAACRSANVDGAALLSEACQARGIHCTVFSSDLVFGAPRSEPWLESDTTSPCNAYGRSKADLEDRVLRTAAKTLIVRTAAFFSPFDPHNFAYAVEQTLRQDREFHASADHWISPAYVPDLVNAVLDLVIDGEAGIWHLASGSAVTWSQFARQIASWLDLDAGLVIDVRPDQLGWRVPRPVYSALGSERGTLMASLDDAIDRHARERHRQSADEARHRLQEAA